MENSPAAPYKVKQELPHEPAILLLATYLRKMKTYSNTKTHTPMFTAALFIIAESGDKYPSVDEWINNTRHMRTMENHWAIKRNETLIHCNMNEP